ncbi:Polysaccharide biosynthesis protein [Planctomycetes bacterium Poly30]|uniref:Polysaccharide biosynthesis protein n=1 Tax=Saltatorellus ferox TaxID=2528018 RepID=A0A518EZZ1_9BACT|nr:Polysaccharide biosynthesis protein [Planctomycetes bacterium Poly30]
MLKHIGSSWLLTILQIVAMLKLTPFMAERLGTESYGVWLEIVALTGALKLLIAGVPMASVRFLSAALGRKDLDEVRRVVSTCFAMCVGLGALAFSVGGAASVYFTGTFLEKPTVAVLGVGESAALAYWVVVASVAMGFVMRLPYGILEAYHDFHHRNAIMAAELLLRFLLSIGLLMHDASIEVLAFAMIFSQVVEFVVALGIVKLRHPEVHFGLAHYDRTLLRSILGFSLFTLLLNMGAQLAFRADALVIGEFLSDPAAIADYDFGNKFFEYLIALVLGIGMVVMPYATRLRAEGDSSDLGGVFLKYSKMALSLSLCVGLYLLVLGPEFLAWWLQDQYHPRSGVVTQILMLSFFAFLPIRGVALPMLMGLGEPRKPAIAFLGMGVLNVALSVALIGPYGLVGVALGTAIPNVLFAGYVLKLACAEIHVPVTQYLRHVFGRALVGSLVPLGFLAWCKWGLDLQGFVPVFGAGAVMVGVFALTWIFFVYRGDPDYDLPALIRRKL